MQDTEFLEKSAKLFLENGAKTFTMDDIAREFRMSKKTLYQKYKNKEALLEDVLTFKFNALIKRMEKLDLEVENAVTRMYCRDEEMEKAIESNNSIFIKQLIKYYPQIFEAHMMRFSEKFSDIMYQNIAKGRKQGYYRKDFNEKLYAKFLFHLMISYHNTPYLGVEEMKESDFCHFVLDFYMNSITTEKGKEFLEKKIIKNLNQ